MPELLYLTTVAALGVLLVCAPAIYRARAIRAIEALMSDFCLAPTQAKASTIHHLLARHKVIREEITPALYGRWMNVRLAMDRLNLFRSTP